MLALIGTAQQPTVKVDMVEPGSARAQADAPPPAFLATQARLDDLVRSSGFSGEYYVSRGGDAWERDTITRTTSISPLNREAYLKALTAPRLWRWASVTKQVIAVLVMQEVAAGRIDLERPIAAYLPDFASPNAAMTTVRQLLRHQSGLPNPDDTTTSADPAAVPAYYVRGYKGSRDPLSGYCAGPVKGRPGGAWSYNNCDYAVVGALLERVTGKPWRKLVQDRIATPFGLTSLSAFPSNAETMVGTMDGKPEPAFDLGAFDAAAGLYGTAKDLWSFDRALMTGKLLPDSARAEMWDGQPRLGSIALGQWVFRTPLKGCAAPVRIVERRGQIGGVEVRNFILPDQDVIAVAFVNRSGFDFGEVWQGKGFSYDLLSAAAGC